MCREDAAEFAGGQKKKNAAQQGGEAAREIELAVLAARHRKHDASGQTIGGPDASRSARDDPRLRAAWRHAVGRRPSAGHASGHDVRRIDQDKVFGVMVAARGDGVKPVPIAEVAGKLKTIPWNTPGSRARAGWERVWETDRSRGCHPWLDRQVLERHSSGAFREGSNKSCAPKRQSDTIGVRPSRSQHARTLHVVNRTQRPLHASPAAPGDGRTPWEQQAGPPGPGAPVF